MYVALYLNTKPGKFYKQTYSTFYFLSHYACVMQAKVIYI